MQGNTYNCCTCGSSELQSDAATDSPVRALTPLRSLSCFATKFSVVLFHVRCFGAYT